MKPIKNTAPGGRGFLGIEIDAGATKDVANDVWAAAQKDEAVAAWVADGTLVEVGASASKPAAKDPPKDAGK